MTPAARILRPFERACDGGAGVLIVYLMVGDPDPASTTDLVAAAIASGADIVELGMPFSDPVADGPTIQAAGQRALDGGGVDLDQVLRVAAETTANYPDAGLIVMGYANPFWQYGLTHAAEQSAAAGVGAWIVPDLPVEESEPFATPLKKAGLDLVPLLAPTTPAERAVAIVEALAPPFAYYVSVTGVTGARGGLPDRWQRHLSALRDATSVPFAVGFGVSTPALAAEVHAHAEGVIVGSALIDRIQAGPLGSAVDRVASFVAGLRAAI